MKAGILIAIALLAAALLASCTTVSTTPSPTKEKEPEPSRTDSATTEPQQSTLPDTSPTPKPYVNITAEEAKKIMDSDAEYVILDVRTLSEYNQGHIPGAILIPHTEISTKAPTAIPDKSTMILVYCRSGNRSKTASELLLELGYTNIKEFGGIIDWQYDIEY